MMDNYYSVFQYFSMMGCFLIIGLKVGVNDIIKATEPADYRGYFPILVVTLILAALLSLIIIHSLFSTKEKAVFLNNPILFRICIGAEILYALYLPLHFFLVDGT